MQYPGSDQAVDTPGYCDEHSITVFEHLPVAHGPADFSIVFRRQQRRLHLFFIIHEHKHPSGSKPDGCPSLTFDSGLKIGTLRYFFIDTEGNEFFDGEPLQTVFMGRHDITHERRLSFIESGGPDHAGVGGIVKLH